MHPYKVGKNRKESVYFFMKGCFFMAKEKKRDKSKSTLSSMQEVTYSREFKMADQAGGFTEKKSRH